MHLPPSRFYRGANPNPKGLFGAGECFWFSFLFHLQNVVAFTCAWCLKPESKGIGAHIWVLISCSLCILLADAEIGKVLGLLRNVATRYAERQMAAPDAQGTPDSNYLVCNMGTRQRCVFNVWSSIYVFAGRKVAWCVQHIL